MGKNYNDWLKEMKEEIEGAINNNTTTMNSKQEKFLPTISAYQQQRILDENKKLVKATWGLAIVTMILAIITWLKS